MIWHSYFDDDADVLMPLIYPPLRSNTMLVVGLNPSFSEIGYQQVLRGTKYEGIEPQSFFHWSNRPSFEIHAAQEIEDLARKHYSRYYSKHEELSQYLGIDWEHIDLFFYRATNQAELRKAVLNRSSLNSFGKSQVDLCWRLLSSISPRIIFVANALASRIFHREHRPVFDDSLGCHKVKIHYKGTPVFFSSMFTRGAMDSFSFQRLKWHSKRVLEKTSPK